MKLRNGFTSVNDKLINTHMCMSYLKKDIPNDLKKNLLHHTNNDVFTLPTRHIPHCVATTIFVYTICTSFLLRPMCTQYFYTSLRVHMIHRDLVGAKYKTCVACETQKHTKYRSMFKEKTSKAAFFKCSIINVHVISRATGFCM